MYILLTNDDGIYAPGLRSLYQALCDAGHQVQVVAPMTEQSAVSSAITVFQPLRIRRLREAQFTGIGVYGTPTDCVKLALSRLLPRKPELLLSGINAGPNAGPDILLSGTVAAAAAGAHAGIPAMAISYNDYHAVKVDEQARHAAALAGRLDWARLPSRCVLNLNYPCGSLADALPLRICPQSSALWRDTYEQRQDPRNSPYWWLAGIIPEEEEQAQTDWTLVRKGHITLTPLRFDLTDWDHLPLLEALADSC